MVVRHEHLSGVLAAVVQQMGEWKSVCYRVYLDQLPITVHDNYRKLFKRLLPK